MEKDRKEKKFKHCRTQHKKEKRDRTMEKDRKEKKFKHCRTQHKKEKRDWTMEKDKKEKKRNLNTVEHSIRKKRKKKTNIFRKIDSALIEKKKEKKLNICELWLFYRIVMHCFGPWFLWIHVECFGPWRYCVLVCGFLQLLQVGTCWAVDWSVVLKKPGEMYCWNDQGP